MPNASSPPRKVRPTWGYHHALVHPAIFLTRKWRLSGHGNRYLKVRGILVVVFCDWDRRWFYQVAGEYSPRSFDSEREAKLAAFEALQRTLPLRSSPPPRPRPDRPVPPRQLRL